MKRTVKHQTRNGAYTSGQTIRVKGGMLHSYGCPQPNPNVLATNWNKPSAGACVHEHIGKDEVIETLPCMETKGIARRSWHAGSSANDTHLSAEMTEPSTIRYIGGANWVECGDGSNTKAHILATYKNAVEEFARWCKFHDLDPLKDGVILSHAEGHKRGIASGHADVEHIWKYFGLTMNQFRKDVKAAMGGVAIETVPSVPVDNSSDDTSKQVINPLNGTVTIIYKGVNGDDGVNVRKAPSFTAEVDQCVSSGIFTVVGISKDEKWYKLKSGLFITTIPDYVKFKATEEQKASTAGTGYYRVREEWDKDDTQIGAFKDKENAIDMCKQNSGYKVFDNDGNEIYPCVKEEDKPFMFRVIVPYLRIRKGPGTGFDYHKNSNGSTKFTGISTFTIIKTKEGQGAKLWGLLKSYKDNENGWIALDEEYGKRV